MNQRRNSVNIFEKPSIEYISKKNKKLKLQRSSSVNRIDTLNDPKFKINDEIKSISSGDSSHERFGNKLGFSSEALKKYMDKRYELKKQKLTKQKKKLIHRKSEYGIDMNILSKLGS